MPNRFRTVKFVKYVIRRRGGWVKRHIDGFPTYTFQLPDADPQGPFTRFELIDWANQHL